MEEIFDVLTENGEFTDETATREECHKKGLWHRATVVFVMNSKNEILLQQRSGQKGQALLSIFDMVPIWAINVLQFQRWKMRNF